MDYKKIENLVLSTKSIVDDVSLNHDVRSKGDADFVTAVDLGISNYLKMELGRLYPDIAFFSEEEESEFRDPTWILDPIDGTTNLVYGYNMSSVSLALYRDGRVEYGVVFNPFSGECFTAVRNRGAFLNGKPLQVSRRGFKQSIIEFGAGVTYKEDADRNFLLAREIFKRCLDLRRICSSALTLCFVAAGRIDGYFETVLKPWDYAAASLILAEAGGTTSDYAGNPLPFTHPGTIIATNGKIHDELRTLINQYQ